MTHTAKHTPGPSTEDIMMFFDLSNEDWDDLTGRMQDQLRDAYISHTDPVRAAAPAMYEALQDIVEGLTDEITRMVEGDKPATARLDYLANKAGLALAQAEGRQA